MQLKKRYRLSRNSTIKQRGMLNLWGWHHVEKHYSLRDYAAFFHSLRVDHQVILWKELSNKELDPLQWGWKLDGKY